MTVTLGLTDAKIRSILEEIYDEYSDYKFRYPDEYSEKWDQRYKQEMAYIKNFTESLSKDTLCAKILNIFENDLLDIQGLIDDGNKKFYNPIFMKKLSCVLSVSTSIYNPYPEDKNNLNIAKLWGNLKKISSGDFGSVYIVLEESFKDGFVIKYIKSTNKERPGYEAAHELFISLVLNKKRSTIPNFMYGYGYFTCSSPIVTAKDKIYSLCDFNEEFPYIILEKIPGRTFKDFLIDSSTDVNEFISYYIQILLALYSVRDMNFSHNDLHPGNIIMRENDDGKPFYIPYTFKGKKIYIKTDKIPVIIDFGYSYIEYNGEKYGEFNLERDGIYPNNPNTIRDAYKLLMFSAYILTEAKKSELAEDLDPLFMFFNEYDNFIDIVKLRRKKIYNIGRYQDYSHEKLIEYIMKVYDYKFLDKPATDGIDISYTPMKDEKELDFGIKKGVKSLMHFFDSGRSFPNLRDRMINEYIKDDAYEKFIYPGVEKYTAMVNYIVEGVSNSEAALRAIEALPPVDITKAGVFTKFYVDFLGITRIFGYLTQTLIHRDTLLYMYFTLEPIAKKDPKRSVLIKTYETDKKLTALLTQKVVGLRVIMDDIISDRRDYITEFIWSKTGPASARKALKKMAKKVFEIESKIQVYNREKRQSFFDFDLKALSRKYLR